LLASCWLSLSSRVHSSLFFFIIITSELGLSTRRPAAGSSSTLDAFLSFSDTIFLCLPGVHPGAGAGVQRGANHILLYRPTEINIRRITHNLPFFGLCQVFIPELGQVLHAAPGFRLFGAQNPVQEGGGRRGLPRSFLNRFTRVAIELLASDDLLYIAGARCVFRWLCVDVQYARTRGSRSVELHQRRVRTFDTSSPEQMLELGRSTLRFLAT